MPPVTKPFRVLFKSTPVDIHLVELPDGRVVARTADELEHASDELRLAAGLEPRKEPVT